MTISEYSRRMNRVLDHIDQHLDAPLVLDDLARVAHFSPFHFHRVFAAWLGETLGDYLQRRRLEAGAARLAAQPHVSVLGVALSVGFGSGEAFARAFKRQFGCTPSSQKHVSGNAEQYQNPHASHWDAGFFVPYCDMAYLHIPLF
ncbi:AraC-like DNA-binding protein [Oxalobacteraceae bacterium GrIS 1.11]